MRFVANSLHLALSSWSALRVLGTVALICTVSACKSEQDEEARSSDGRSEKPPGVLNEPPPSFPAAPLTLGAHVYDFSALAHNGQLARLSEFWHKPVVVYFCPRDRADVCTALALSVRDAWTDLHSQVGMVFAVSPEPTIVHREFSTEHKLPHLFLTDADATLQRVFGIQPGAVVSYVVGAKGVVHHVFAPPGPNHGTEILDRLKVLGLDSPDYPI